MPTSPEGCGAAGAAATGEDDGGLTARSLGVDDAGDQPLRHRLREPVGVRMDDSLRRGHLARFAVVADLVPAAFCAPAAFVDGAFLVAVFLVADLVAVFVADFLVAAFLLADFEAVFDAVFDADFLAAAFVVAVFLAPVAFLVAAFFVADFFPAPRPFPDRDIARSRGSPSVRTSP